MWEIDLSEIIGRILCTPVISPRRAVIALRFPVESGGAGGVLEPQLTGTE